MDDIYENINDYYGNKNILIVFDDIITDVMTNGHEKWPYIPDHPFKILIIAGSGSGKTNALINLINEEHDIDKMYLYARDLSGLKYEYLNKKT